MSEEHYDIRWKQRFENYQKALTYLSEAIEIDQPSIVQRAGTIQFFEMSFELAWKTLKDYLEYQGFADVKSPKATLKKAFEIELLEDGHTWLEALENRNRAAHTYNDETAQEIFDLIRDDYYPLMEHLKERLEALENE